MPDTGFELPDGRARIGWWVFVLALAAAAAFVAYSFVGMVVLGVFGYYATRPIYQRLKPVIGSDGIAAWLTLLTVLLPVAAILFFAGFQLFQQVQQSLGNTAGTLALLENYLGVGTLPAGQRQTLAQLIQDPGQVVSNPRQTLQRVLQTGMRVVSAAISTVLLLGLSVTLSYFLLKNDEELSDGLRQLFGGGDTTAYAYAAAVDEDIESVFFGNFLFVVVMAVIAAAVYWGTNLVAPPELQIPMVFVLAFLTGVASLVPIVVGKVIYLPVVAYLGFQAVRLGGNQLPLVGGLLVVYFLVLDILPQTFIQPYITGRQLDMVVMMFAYLLGPTLFGWYGFFLLPILFVLMLEVVRIVLPELVHGESLTPTVSMGESVGADPQSTRAESLDGDAAESGDE
ncbi:Predicted PurR-regulated permease PerM [Halopelagius inordinatus]|uniref:Predicted PurR-regulated permease PerM n=1 Tax=Halopelagius inordinatus TaxID=553467 RepID=A0A1I2NE99_9EURY|nr:AI-2E family transporter [Halopelagius inordinatus]SFG01400.1 Predicted PurR-regulated permease PerM [Halopelagius inordinatus]